MPSLLYGATAQVVTLTLHRPAQGNSLNDGLITALLHHLSVLENHRSARLLVLRGAGGAFCRGIDPSSMNQWRRQPLAETTAAVAPLAALLRLLQQFSVPTVAVVEGDAYGCGAALAACCDLLIATENARFAWAEPALGTVLPVSLAVLMQALGRAGAPYLLSHTPLSAQDAQRAGLVHEVVPDVAAALAAWHPRLIAGDLKQAVLGQVRAGNLKEAQWVERTARLLCTPNADSQV
jgi:methylglutaconyl-CoA hydratase